MNNIHMSEEDNKHDTNYINKNNDANHDTRKLHLWARHIERAVSSSHVWCHMHFIGSSCPWVFTSSHLHAWASLLDLTFLPFYFDLSFTVFFHSSVLIHPEPHTDLDNLNTVQHNLRPSAKGSNDAYDVTVSLTGYEPNDTVSNDTVFNELVNSQGSFSYVTPSSDLDIDDTTLGKLIDEAHREHADYRNPEGVSCQSVSRYCLSYSIEQWNLWEKEMSISQLVLVSRETRTVLTASFLKTPKLRKWSIEQGNLLEKAAQTHRLGPCLMNRDRWLSQNTARKLVITNSKAARAEEERRILQEELWRQQKDFREVHQQSLTEMEELRKFQSSTFDTLARRKLIEDQNTIFELSGRVQGTTKWSKLYERF